MKILLATCIVIDFLQGREPFAEDAYQIFRLLATEIFSAYITAKSTTDIYYLTRRCTHSDEEAKDKLNRLLGVLKVADTLSEDIFNALISEAKDFEDAVMMETALRIKADGIVTRNTKDYKNSSVKVYTPKEFIKCCEESFYKT